MNINSKLKAQRSKLFLIFIIIAGIIVLPVFLSVNGKTSATDSPTVTSTVTSEDRDIKAFKEKIASKVAQLRQKNSRVISGYVTEKTDNSLKMKTDNSQIYEIKLDQMLTKYHQIKGNQQSEIKYSDIEKGDYIIVSGIGSDKVLTANFIFIDEEMVVLSGRINEVNRENYTLKVETVDRDNYLLDIETTTKQQMINIKTLQIEKTGFSKIKEGDFIHFVIKKTATSLASSKEDRYYTHKILIIPQEYFLK